MSIIDLFSTRFAHEPSHPLMIAEAGVNHEGDMELAKRLIDEAKRGGADAIKFQTYKAETLASKTSPAYWDRSKEPTSSQYQLFKKYDKFWKKEYEEIKKYCDQVGIEFLSTPFDIESAKFLDALMPIYKISSSDLTNKPFIEYLCSFGKPLIMSVGASTFWEAARAVEWVEAKGSQLAIMHCVLNYPNLESNANIGMILDLVRRFPGHPIGYSDHVPPGDLKTLELAVMLGARVIEKHFTFDKTLPGNDHYHSMDWKDLVELRALLDRDFEIMGKFRKGSLPSEQQAREHARRSLVAARGIAKGSAISKEDLTWKRPGSGISPAEIDLVVGMRAVGDIEQDAILQWGMLY